MVAVVVEVIVGMYVLEKVGSHGGRGGRSSRHRIVVISGNTAKGMHIYEINKLEEEKRIRCDGGLGGRKKRVVHDNGSDEMVVLRELR